MALAVRFVNPTLSTAAWVGSAGGRIFSFYSAAPE